MLPSARTLHWLLLSVDLILTLCKQGRSKLLVAGACFVEYTAHPCYWKNGLRTDLITQDEKFGSGYINGICVSEGNVYTAGTVQHTAGHTIPCYWKNNIRVTIHY